MPPSSEFRGEAHTSPEMRLWAAVVSSAFADLFATPSKASDKELIRQEALYFFCSTHGPCYEVRCDISDILGMSETKMRAIVVHALEHGGRLSKNEIRKDGLMAAQKLYADVFKRRVKPIKPAKREMSSEAEARKAVIQARQEEQAHRAIAKRKAREDKQRERADFLIAKRAETELRRDREAFVRNVIANMKLEDRPDKMAVRAMPAVERVQLVMELLPGLEVPPELRPA